MKDLIWEFDNEERPFIHPDFEGYEQFYYFLKDNNILDEYTKNFRHKSINYFLKKNKDETFIMSAFLWRNDKWRTYHRSWLKILHKS